MSKSYNDCLSTRIRCGNSTPAEDAIADAAPDLLAALESVTQALSHLADFRCRDGTLRIVSDTGDRTAYAGTIIDEKLAAARAALARVAP